MAQRSHIKRPRPFPHMTPYLGPERRGPQLGKRGVLHRAHPDRKKTGVPVVRMSSDEYLTINKNTPDGKGRQGRPHLETISSTPQGIRVAVFDDRGRPIRKVRQKPKNK